MMKPIMSTDHRPLIELCHKTLSISKQEMAKTGGCDGFAAISFGAEFALIETEGELWNDPRYRERFSETVREKVRELNADFVVFVSDVYIGRAHTDFGMEAALSVGGDIPRAHALGLVTKREAILAKGEHRDGFEYQLVQFYRRDVGDPRQVIWEEQKSEESQPDDPNLAEGGRHAGWFRKRVPLNEAYRRYKAAKG